MRFKAGLVIWGISAMTLTGCGEKIENLTDKGVEALDKVQEVDATVSNGVSTVSVKVQLVKNMEYEYDGGKFTLKELFESVLDHPKWKTDEIEGVKVVIVSGGLKENILGEDFNGFAHEKAIKDVLEETARVSFVFPFYEDQFLPDEEIGFYYEVGGEKITSTMGTSILEELFEVYSADVKKE